MGNFDHVVQLLHHFSTTLKALFRAINKARMVLKALIVRSLIKFLFLVAPPHGVKLEALILNDSECIV